MHFMAPVNIKSNGKTNSHVVSPTTSISSPSSVAIVYSSCDIPVSKVVQSKKMAPRTFPNGRSTMAASSTPVKDGLLQQQSSNGSPSSLSKQNDDLAKVCQDPNGVRKNNVPKTISLVDSFLPLCDSSSQKPVSITGGASVDNSYSSFHSSFSGLSPVKSAPFASNLSQTLRGNIHMDSYRQVETAYRSSLARMENLLARIQHLSKRGSCAVAQATVSHVPSGESRQTQSSTLCRPILEAFALEMDSDDTDSSSDEEEVETNDLDETRGLVTSEADSKFRRRLSPEDSWLCARAAYHAQWHWLLSEVQHTEFALKNLRALGSECQQRRRPPIAPQVGLSESGQCSRTLPVTSASQLRRTIHRVTDNLETAELLSAGIGGSGVVDGDIRCNCRSPETGPCLLCCGRVNRTRSSRPWTQLTLPEMDLVQRALPLDSSMHPKMSFVSDISHGIKLESRLSNASRPLPEHWSTPRLVTIPHPEVPPRPPPPMRIPPSAAYLERSGPKLSASSSSTSSPSSTPRPTMPSNSQGQMTHTRVSPRLSHRRRLTTDLGLTRKSEVGLMGQARRFSHGEVGDGAAVARKRRRMGASDGSSSGEGAPMGDSRRSSTELLFDCASPSPGATRLFRPPKSFVELPAWKVNPSVSQVSSRLLRHHVTSDLASPAAGDLGRLRLEAVSESGLQEDPSDASYTLRHAIEEEKERRRVWGFPGSGSDLSSCLTLSGSLTTRSRGHRLPSGHEYVPSTQAGYPPRHFPLTDWEVAVVQAEEEDEQRVPVVQDSSGTDLVA